MTEPKAIRSDHVAEHPAFRAWARVHGSQAAPTKIEVLKQTKRKTMVCRLSGSGTEMEIVIAKRSFRHYIGVERIIYAEILDRKSTRLNSSHVSISYAVFCLKKKT